jgi:hypothetical protein
LVAATMVVKRQKEAMLWSLSRIDDAQAKKDFPSPKIINYLSLRKDKLKMMDKMKATVPLRN